MAIAGNLWRFKAILSAIGFRWLSCCLLKQSFSFHRTCQSVEIIDHLSLRQSILHSGFVGRVIYRGKHEISRVHSNRWKSLHVQGNPFGNRVSLAELLFTEAVIKFPRNMSGGNHWMFNANPFGNRMSLIDWLFLRQSHQRTWQSDSSLQSHKSERK